MRLGARGTLVISSPARCSPRSRPLAPLSPARLVPAPRASSPFPLPTPFPRERGRQRGYPFFSSARGRARPDRAVAILLAGRASSLCGERAAVEGFGRGGYPHLFLSFPFLCRQAPLVSIGQCQNQCCVVALSCQRKNNQQQQNSNLM